MESIVLAPTAPAPVQIASQNGQTNSESETSFAPILSQAIAKKDGGSENTASDTTSDTAVPSTFSQDNIDIGSDSSSSSLEQFDLFLDAEPRSYSDYSAFGFMFNANQVMSQQLLAEVKELPVENLGQAAAVSIFAETEPQIATVIPADVALNLNPSATPVSEGLQVFLENNMATGQTTSQILPTNTAVQNKEPTLTLTQLQEIIASNETKGVVVQQQPQNAITLDELTTLTPQNLNIQTTTVSTTAATEVIETTSAANQFAVRTDIPVSEGSSTKAPALRQDIHHQFLDGKLLIEDNQDNKEGGKQADQRNNDSSNGQQAAQILQTGTTSQGNATVESTLFSLPVQNPVATQQTAHQGNTLTLPSGTTVAEQEILNQVVQRFQMSSRLQNSKISLKLHPAELGELKINLTIKEGTIKASVFAQNQHVQEIIERNMPKLKSVLEQQGFTIDEIVVTSKPETVGDYDLFGEQFSNPQTFTSSDGNNQTTSSFETVLDTSMQGSTFPESGLNVKA